MISSFNNGARVGGSRILIQLLAFVLLLLGAAFTAQAENCSDYPGGILDGFAGTIAPSQLQIDRNCTIRNYPASNPLGTNFSFLTQPGQTDQRWLVIFDNVVHTGQMACNAVAEHRIWFVNGSSTSIKEGCQNYLIPVEKIDKKNPDGQTTATIGVPFTYKLTMPVLFAPATNVVIDYSGSADDLHSTVITDDLNATGADLTYISHVAYWEDTGAAVPHTFSNAGGLLTFSDFPIIPGRAPDRYRAHRRARRHAGERDRHAIRQHGQVVLRTAHRQRVLRATAWRVGHLTAVDDCSAAARGRQDGPGDAEHRSMGAVLAVSAEHRPHRRVGRDYPRPLPRQSPRAACAVALQRCWAPASLLPTALRPCRARGRSPPASTSRSATTQLPLANSHSRCSRRLA
jgi:hypothetical protein